jgi:large subunit ribosomal protein L21
MKYAIVEHSGKQYMAQEGGLIEVDRMQLEVGKQIVFKDILFVTDGKKAEVGAPFVKGASVKGKVQDHLKGNKITVFKYKPKQRYRRKQGHRQLLTHISIESIGLPKDQKAETKKKKEPKSKSTQSTKSGVASKTSAKKSESASEKKSTSASKKKSTSASEKKSTSKPKAAKKE